MIALLRLLLAILASPFKSKCRLEAENAALRHQVMVLRACSRIQLTNFDATPWRHRSQKVRHSRRCCKSQLAKNFLRAIVKFEGLGVQIWSRHVASLRR
jgi:hypothetical protein